MPNPSSRFVSSSSGSSSDRLEVVGVRLLPCTPPPLPRGRRRGDGDSAMVMATCLAVGERASKRWCSPRPDEPTDVPITTPVPSGGEASFHSQSANRKRWRAGSRARSAGRPLVAATYCAAVGRKRDSRGHVLSMRAWRLASAAVLRCCISGDASVFALAAFAFAAASFLANALAARASASARTRAALSSASRSDLYRASSTSRASAARLARCATAAVTARRSWLTPRLKSRNR